jgi:MOSC domain-containing protein YiiM
MTSLQQPVASARHLTREEVEAGLDAVRAAPRDAGVLELIVRRPAVDEREVVEEAKLDLEQGLVGDNWASRGRSGGRPANVDAQITVTGARAIDLVASHRERWPLAGDQLYVDLDISRVNLPPGTRLAIGTAVIEVTAAPHTGCKKFAARFGLEALKVFDTDEGLALSLRGINARVVEPGTIRAGDPVSKLTQ